MSLGFGNRKAQRGTSVKMGEGVFVDEGTIRAVRAEYDTLMYEKSQYRDDVALRMMLDVEGLSFKKEMYIGGRYQKTPTGGGKEAISGWGSAFKVARVFDELGIEGKTDEDGRFDPRAVEALRDRRIFFLQYISGTRDDNGKPRYSDYNIIAAQRDGETEEEVRQRLYAQFRKDVDGGFIKNFQPGAGRAEQTEFAFGANVGEPITADAAPWDE